MWYKTYLIKRAFTDIRQMLDALDRARLSDVIQLRDVAVGILPDDSRADRVARTARIILDSRDVVRGTQKARKKRKQDEG